MTPLEALERVAEAARELRQKAHLFGIASPPALAARDALNGAIDALDALPPAAPEPVGEVVAPLRAVSMTITPADSGGPWVRHVVMADGSLWDQICGEWVRVPLPVVPEIVREVEG